MGNRSTSNASGIYNAFHNEILNEDVNNSWSSSDANIILNHDFSEELNFWHPNNCNGSVISSESWFNEGISAKTGSHFAVITNRSEYWQGLEQDITTRVSQDCTYTVSACVGVSGPLQGSTIVQATLRIEFRDSPTCYMFIASTSVSKGQWKKLEGTFSLSTMPDQVVFYLEGPPPGVDLLIESVVISSSSSSELDIRSPGCVETGSENIIWNPIYEEGLKNWSGRGCNILLNDEIVGERKILPLSGKFFAAAIDRAQSCNGIQQEITGRVKRKHVYEVTAIIRIFGDVNNADVQATLWVQTLDSSEHYIGIAKSEATDKDWVQLKGKFLLNGYQSRVVIYLEGPPPGTNILVNSLVVKLADKTPPSLPVIQNTTFGINIISNGNFNDGMNGWFPVSNCTLSIGMGSPRILPPMARESLGPHEPLSGCYILVTNRTQNWMGLAQTITNKIELFLSYQVTAWVRIVYGAMGPQNVNISLDVDSHWVNGGQVEINDDRWHEISGSFRIEKQPAEVVLHIQGPDPGVGLMVAGFQIFPVNRQARFKYLKRQTDKIRKRDVILKLSGLDSSSLRGTFVKVRQTKNSFPLGSFVSRTNIDNEDFVDFFVKHFNYAVFENELNGHSSEAQHGDFNQRDANELLNFCEAHNIEKGVPAGVIEIEGHIDSPVGAIVCSTLDKSAMLGIPIWFTEVDVSSINEYGRADDLEVVLREAFAHPGVHGVVLSGFWELFTRRENSHLVNAEGEINEAGKRYITLKQEWLTHAHGHVDEEGQFRYRGFQGAYEVEVVTLSKKVSKTFVVDKGESPLVVSIDF